MQTALKGDLGAFNRLVMEHQDGLYTFAYRVFGNETGAAEAMNATLRSAYRDLAHYRGPVRLWLLRHLSQACREMLENGRPGNAGSQVAGLDGLRESLPVDLCLTLALVDGIELSYADCGQVLGISPERVKQRVALARQQVMPGIFQ